MNILQYEFVQNALIAGVLLSITAGIIGSLIVIKRDTFLIGGIAHASFGGLGLFYFLGLNPILGAFSIALASGSFIGLSNEKQLQTHNALIGVLWAFGMSIGIIFITITPGYAPNLLTYLFGDILTVTPADILNIAIYNIILLVFLFLFYKPMIVYLFDKEFAALHGIRVRLYRFVFYIFIAIAVVLMIRSVGIILVLALLTIPPLIVLPLFKRLPMIILMSVIVSLVIFISGFFIAYYTNLPTGPIIIATGTLFTIDREADMPSKEKEFLVNAYHKIIQAVQPDALYEKYLHVFDNSLYFKNTFIDLNTPGKLILAGSGKASLSMGQAFLPYLSQKADGSLFIAPSEAPEAPFTVLEGSHPIPNTQSLEAGKRMYEFIGSLTEQDTLIYFLSGGSSSLLEYPESGVSLDDLQKATSTFLSCGMNINEINVLRGALSKIKAGKLGDICRAKCYVFVLSDVMGNDLSTIGSGPFYRTQADPDLIHALILKYKLASLLPAYMIDIFKAYDTTGKVDHIPHYLIGSNMDLLEAAELVCFDESIRPLSFPESLFGESEHAGKMIADMLKFYSGPKPTCMLFGGETTVTIDKPSGKGGRSQELALSVLEKFHDLHGVTLLSAGSDGMDGIGGAAGAIVDPDTFKAANSLGLSIQGYLLKHDSYHFHKQCGSLITTGYSGTNVGDVVMALIVES